MAFVGKDDGHGEYGDHDHEVKVGQQDSTVLLHGVFGCVAYSGNVRESMRNSSQSSSNAQANYVAEEGYKDATADDT